MKNIMSSTSSTLRKPALLRGGRMGRVGGRVVSYAPLLGFAVAISGGVAQAADDSSLINGVSLFAANECGPASPGAVITCSGPSYPAGITYSGLDGLTLNLANPAMTVANPGVGIAGASGTAGAVNLNATSFATIASTDNNTSAVRAVTSGTGAAAVALASGLVTTAGSGANGVLAQVANAANTSSATVTMNSGTVRTDQLSASGLFAFNQGRGASHVTINGGSIEILYSGNVAGTFGAQSRTSNAGNSSAATILMQDGSITTSGRSTGLGAVTSGVGNTTVTLNGGSVRTLGDIANGVASTILNVNSTATAVIEMNGGAIDTSGRSSVALNAATNGIGMSSVVVNGGSILTRGLAAHAAFASTSGTGSPLAQVVMTDGNIATTGQGARGLVALVSSAGAASVVMQGGSISTQGASSFALSAQIDNAASTALASIQMSGGSIVTSSDNASGLRIDNAGSGGYSVVMDGGTVATSGANAFGIHTLGSGTGTVAIGSAAVISSASGVAIRDGAADADRWGGSVSITSAGTLTGGVRMGLGNDVFALTGGSTNGDVYGDDLASQAGDGNDTFRWSGGTFRGGFFGGGGADTAIISAAGYDSTQDLAGGSGPGTDTLTFDSVNARSLNDGVSGWEQLSIVNRSIVGLAGGAGAQLGNLDIGAGSTLLAFEGLVLGGSVSSAGTIDLSGNGQAGTVFEVGADFSGGGTAVLDVALADAGLLSSDRLVIGGDVAGTTRLVMKNSTPGLGAATTGDGILVAEVAGAASAQSFVLASGPLVAGAYVYDLDQGEQAGTNNVYLVSRLAPDASAIQAAPFLIATSFVDLPSLEKRHAGRLQVGEDQGAGGAAQGQGSRRAPLGPWAQMGGAQDRLEASNANSYKTNRWDLKAGYDADAGIPWPGSLIVGGYVTYAGADSSIDSHYGSQSVTSQAAGAGATLTYYAPQGSYVDLQGLVMGVNSDFDTESGVISAAAAGSAEVGHVFAVGAAASLIPSAQLQYGSVSASPFSYGADGVDNEVSGFGEDGFTGRVGLALQSALSGGNGHSPVLTASLDYIRDFSPTIGVAVNGNEVETDVPENWLEAGIGLDWQLGQASLVHLRAGYAAAIGERMADNGSLNALASFQLGF